MMKNHASPFSVQRGRYWLSRSLLCLMGLVLLVAALSKATDMGLFLRQIREYGLIHNPWVILIMAWSLVALEFVLGTALLVSFRLRLSLPVTLLLLLVFLGADLWAWLTGATEDCGCFGSWIERTPGEAVLETIILLIITLIAWVGLRPSPSTHRPLKTGLVLAALLAGLIFPPIFGIPLAPPSASPWESIETTLRNLELPDLEQPAFKKGSHMILIFDTECSHCRENLEEMNSLSEDANTPSITALCTNDEEQRNAFQEEFGPNFRIYPIGEAPFWQLLGDGDIPRVILLRDERVKGVWDKEIPSVKDVMSALGK